jgi:hypothetical protein
VSATDGGRVFEFKGAGFEDGEEMLDALVEDGGGGFELESLGGVDDIVGGEAVVQPARFGADRFGDGGGEGDDVVADFGLDFVDAVERKAAAVTDGAGRFGGNQAVLGENFAGEGFNFQPGAELAFLAPDGAHGGAGVARDQSGKPPENSSF